MVKLRILLMTATLMPLPCLALALTHGAAWAAVALVYMTVFSFLADQSVRDADKTHPDISRFELWIGDILPLVQGVVHFALLAMAVLVLADPSGPALTDKIILFAAFGIYFGTFSASTAHELIHRTDRLHHHLGKWVFISLLFGHHVTAHLSVHHRFVATGQDPNSARLNESFHRFFRRAWLGSFRAGLAVENTRLSSKGLGRFHLTNPYFIYVLGAAVLVMAAGATGGMVAVAIYLGFGFFAQMQLLLSDYVQHYGLRRKIRTNGTAEPVSPHHSWNAPQLFSAAIMLNAPRHSDHHTHPNKPYPALQQFGEGEAPRLPYSIPVMSCIAVVPVLWTRLMNPRVTHWQKQNADLAA